MEQKTENRACLFVRVSTDKQEFERQILELTGFCDQRNLTVTKTIATKISGMKTQKDRPDLQELFDGANKQLFDKVIVSEISRIGRNAKDIRNTISFLHAKHIPVVFKNLGGIESIDENGNESFVTNIIISIYAELAQEERRILSDRIKSGLKMARVKGKHIGRPEGSGMSREKLLKKYSGLAKDLRAGTSLRRCVKLHTVSKGVVVKVKRSL